MGYKILVINPGSTSTKIACFEDEKELIKETLKHSTEELNDFKKISEQYEFRKNIIINFLEKNSIKFSAFSAIAARGGLLHPLESGVYQVNEDMISDLKDAKNGEHASNLGALIAFELSKQFNINSYIVDPVIVDEMNELAKISGLKGIRRKSIFHALNQKVIVRQVAYDLSKKYEEMNLIVAHLGGGISIGAHEKGRVIDVNNALNGDGPFAPERAGGLPTVSLARLCYSGKYTESELKKKLAGEGGLVSHLQTSDATIIEKRIENGDEYAKLVYEAMAYQISKTIGEMSAVLKGKVDGIVLTGGLAYSKMLTDWIKERVSFIAKVYVYPGEDEMKALANGVLRVLKKEETPKEYKKEET